MSTFNDCTIGGRAATVQSFRVQHTVKSRGYYSRVIVRFHDNNETLSMGAAEFAKWSARADRLAKAGAA